MADTLVSFDNLKSVLEEFATEFRETYKAELVKHDRFTQHGQDRLIDSVDANTVQTMVHSGERAWNVTIDLRPYWKWVEFGTGPHWPPPGAILRWVQVKPVVPRPDSRGRIPSEKSLAYLIGRKISRVGTEGSGDFVTAKEAVLARFKARIRAAIAADIRNYVRDVLAR